MACTKFIEHFEKQLVQTGVCQDGAIVHLGNPTILPSPNAAMKTTLREALQDLHAESLSENADESQGENADDTESGQTSENTNKTPDIVVLLLKKKDQDVYSSFKYLTDKVFCFQSICATQDNFKPKDTVISHPNRPDQIISGWQNDNAMRQYMANVAMKANLKVCGVNHTVTGIDSLLKRTLVLGADLTHPGNGAVDGCPSISGVVSSVEGTGGWFLGQSYLQPKSEIIKNLDISVKLALLKWIDENDAWPENVLYYRDGVSESQYDDIKQKEDTAIENAWNICVKEEEAVAYAPPLKLTTVIVTKRHSTRFFPEKAAYAMFNNENCKPGLLVDSAVTHPYYGDFYLQSHNAIKGTARPCHYFVLRNDMNISMPDLQAFVSSPKPQTSPSQKIPQLTQPHPRPTVSATHTCALPQASPMLHPHTMPTASANVADATCVNSSAPTLPRKIIGTRRKSNSSLMSGRRVRQRTSKLASRSETEGGRERPRKSWLERRRIGRRLM